MSAGQRARGSVILRQVESDHIRYQSTRGALILPPRFGTVFHYEVEGHFDAPMVDTLWGLFDELAATTSGRLHGFANFTRMTGYDTETRRRGASGFRARIERWHTFHVLMPGGAVAKLISMALSTIGMVSGVPITSYTDPEVFAAERARLNGPPR